MGYYRHVARLQGDPFPGLGLLAKAAGRLLPKVAPAVGKIFGRGGAKAGPVLRSAGKIAAGGAVFELGSRVTRRALDGGGGGRRYKRMNVANVRALRRAIRRTKGFAKLAKSVLTFTQPRAPKGKALFKSRKRR